MVIGVVLVAIALVISPENDILFWHPTSSIIPKIAEKSPVSEDLIGKASRVAPYTIVQPLERMLM